MLDLEKVDLQDLCEGLEDHSMTTEWWLDPKTCQAIPKSEDLPWDEYGVEDPERLVYIEPLPSYEGYADMEEFISLVRDPRARDLLARAIEGRGAFRRFKDALFDLPELREAWFAFHDARLRRRAIEWLESQGLVKEAEAERALGEIEEPAPPELSGPFDPKEIARAVAAELRQLYGHRLEKVILFGSWARGDAHPESDIDLLVVLDHVESSWEESRRMNRILWSHSFVNDTVVTAVPVGRGEIEPAREPLLIRARDEGVEIPA